MKNKQKAMGLGVRLRLLMAFSLLSGLCLNAAAQEAEVFPQLGHSYQIHSVIFSPDGKQVLSGSGDGTIKLWDANTGREIRTFSGHKSFVHSVAFSPDGRQVLSGSVDHTVKLWDANTGREIRTFSGHRDMVHSIAFSPDGRQVLSGSRDETIKLWDTNTGRQIRTFSGHKDSVESVAFSPDGRQVLSGSQDETIKLWDVNTGGQIRTFSGHKDSVESVAFSPDGKQILSGSWDNTTKLWDANTGREIRTFSGHTSGVYSVAFSPDGRQVLSGSWDKTIKLWDVNTGREIRAFSGHTGNIFSVVFSPDGRQILSGSNDRTIKLWETNTGREIRTYGYTNWVYSITFSPDGRQVLSGSDDKTIKLWDINTGREIRTFTGHKDEVNSIAFSPDGRQVLSGSRQVLSRDETIKLWDTNTGRQIRTFSGHTGWVNSVAFSPDGRQVLSGSNDNTVKLWDVNTGREIRTFTGHTERVTSVAFSPDGRQVLSDSRDGTIKLWDTNTGRQIRTFSGHLNLIESVTFSPDGKQILSGSRDGTIRLWDVSTGKEIAQFISFTDGEWVVITPDGNYNASPNGDKYLNVRVGNNVYGIDQYRSAFYKPQIVEARLQGRPDPVRSAAPIQTAAVNEPPVVVIRSPENGSALSSNQVELSVLVIDQRQPIRTIKVLVNGRLVGGESMRGITGIRGGDLEATGIRLTENQNRVEFRLPVTLDPGVNRIEVFAYNPYEGRDSIEVNYRQTAAQQNILPNLWILSIGINRYDSPLLEDLDYAVNDAREIINVFKTQEGKLYRKVNSLLIADGADAAPTRGNIVDNFRYLRQAGQNDVIMLFMAGHGMNDEDGSYYFMPSDAAFNNDGSIRSSSAIPYREIQAVLDLPGQKLVFIDSCHSQGVTGRRTRDADNNLLVRALQDNSTVIFTASRGSEKSQEISNLRHGVFTYAIIQGMKGEADLIKDGQITMKELDAYVSEMVPKLTNGAQHPTTSTPDGYTNFVVAQLK